MCSVLHRAYPHLLEPIRIGGVLFRNRMFAAPTGLHACSDGRSAPSEAAIAHYVSRAKAGAACVTCAGASIFPVDAARAQVAWDLYDPSSVNILAELARRIQFYGARASMELGVFGVMDRHQVVSQGVPDHWGEPGKEMTREDIRETAEGYASAAQVLQRAGFDMVLLHFGHGLQVGQFLSPLTNRRTDEYGGSLENRARFAVEIIDAIRAAVGRRLLIEVRISGTEYEPGGIEIDEAIAFARMIQDKVDLIQFSAGMHSSKWMTTTHPCAFLPSIPNVWLAERAKAAGLSVPVAAIGGIQDLDEAEEILCAGRADVLTVARGFIADDGLMTKAYEDRAEDVVPCIKCMRCHDSAVYEHTLVCSVNPRVGLEYWLPPDQKAPVPKKVAVIGGGPAGMEAALTAARRGHRVTLYEKGSALGGSLSFAKYIPFKYPLALYTEHMVAQIKKSEVVLRMNSSPTADTLRREGYDAILVAVGARPRILPIPGIGRVIPAKQIFGREGAVTESVVVIGGGQVGGETALHLAKLGQRVTVVQKNRRLAPDASQTHRQELLREMEKMSNLTTYVETVCTEITETEVICTGAAQERVVIPAGTVILAAGLRPCGDVVDALLGAAPRIIPIGDCERVANVEHAVRSAYAAAMSL